MNQMKNIGIIGGGNMGEAILAGIRKDYGVVVSEKDQKRRRYLKRNYRLPLKDIRALVRSSEVIILAVKPQDMDSVLQEIRPVIDQRKLVISIAAGIRTSFIEKRLGHVKVVRTMPNMPTMVKEGMTAICNGKYANHSDLKKTSQLFQHIGRTVIIREEFMDAVTAVSGSGPAYVFLFVECLLKAAEKLGLGTSLSKELVIQTFLGSLKLLSERKEEPGPLRAKVTSKGGTTQAAMDVFMRYRIDVIIAQALRNAKKRARQLSKS
jgi:pyrroline-5-carboxylate reductase